MKTPPLDETLRLYIELERTEILILKWILRKLLAENKRLRALRKSVVVNWGRWLPGCFSPLLPFPYLELLFIALFV